MKKIINVHFPDLKKNLCNAALNIFYNLREMPGLSKRPSTSELLDWIKLLMSEDISIEALHSNNSKDFIPPLYGALIKNEQDIELFEKIAFLDRREKNK